jgi:hypothetical protein
MLLGLRVGAHRVLTLAHSTLCLLKTAADLHLALLVRTAEALPVRFAAALALALMGEQQQASQQVKALSLRSIDVAD